MAENWADLLPELLELCSRQLLLEDWFAFRSVCSTWRAAAPEDRFDVPWLMLADDESTETEWAEFYSLFSLRTHKILLPEVKGKRCFSSQGWIFTIRKDFQVYMLNPLSRAASQYRDQVIKLPSLDKLPEWDPELYLPEDTYADFVDKFFMFASPTSSPNCTVMVIYSNNAKLAIWKPGNEEWKELTSPHGAYFDVAYFKGQLLTLTNEGHLFACDVDRPDPTTQSILLRPSEILQERFVRLYLVEAAGRLLVVSRWGEDDNKADGFDVFAVDLEARKWTRLESMGNVSLFVGYSSSFSVQVDENQHSIKPDCIYFTDDCFYMYRDTEEGGGKDMGIYHMEDGRIESFYDGKSYHHFSPPTWIEPRL